MDKNLKVLVCGCNNRSLLAALASLTLVEVVAEAKAVDHGMGLTAPVPRKWPVMKKLHGYSKNKR